MYDLIMLVLNMVIYICNNADLIYIPAILILVTIVYWIGDVIHGKKGNTIGF